MVFGIAFAWSLGFLLFSLSWYLYFLAIVLGTFALFYFFGKTAKIRVVNQTILALFLGFFGWQLVCFASSRKSFFRHTFPICFVS